MFLLDTNVVSELRKKNSGKIDPNVETWAQSVNPKKMYLSAITILELEIGILSIERKDLKQGTVLRAWFEEAVLPTFEGRVLNFDTSIARHCAKLQVPDPQPERDAIIAATAQAHSMAIVTRNTEDFKKCEALVINPWLK